MSVIPTLPIVNVQVGLGYGGSRTIQLPAVSNTNIQSFLIRDYLGNCSANSNTGFINIIPTGLDTFDTATLLILSTPYQSIKLVRNPPNRWSIEQNYIGGTPVFNFQQFDSNASTIISQYAYGFGYSFVNNTLQCTSNRGSFFTLDQPGSVIPYPTKSFQTAFTFTMSDQALSNGFCFVMYSGAQGAIGAQQYLGYGYNGWAGNIMGVSQLSNSLALRLTLNPTIPFFQLYPNYVSNNAFFTTQGNGMAYTSNEGSNILAVGEDTGVAKYMYRSAAYNALGSSWTKGSLSNMTTGNSILYVGGTINKYVVAGNGTTSLDQLQVTSLISAPTVAWSGIGVNAFNVRGNGVVCDGTTGVIVAVGEGTTGSGSNTLVYRSAVGVWNRISQANGAFQQVGYGVAFNPVNSQWAIAGKDNTNGPIRYSGGSPPTTFSNLPANDAFSDSARGIVAPLNPGNLWIAVGKDIDQVSTIRYNTSGDLSAPGARFIAVNTGGFNVAGNGVAYDQFNNKWVAVGEHTSSITATGKGTIQWSTDGSNFYPANQGFSTAGYAVAYSFGSGWVAVGDDGGTQSSIKYSSDGITWTNASSGYFSTIGYGVAVDSFTPGTFYAVGANSTTSNTLLKSTDGGLTWASPVTGGGGFTKAGRAISRTNFMNEWVLVGESSPANTTIQKFDTITTTLVPYETGGFSVTAYGLATNSIGNQILALGEDATSNYTVKRSSDGSNWTNSANAPFTSARAAIYNAFSMPTQYYAVGYAPFATQTICTSTDGNSWTGSLSGGFSQGGRGIYYNNSSNLYVAVGEDSTQLATIQYSGNGTNWSNIVSGGFSSMGTSVTFDSNLNLWIATGIDSDPTKTIQYSKDGCNWTPLVNGGYTVGALGSVYNPVDGRSYIVGQNTSGSAGIEYSAPTSGVDVCGIGIVSSINALSGGLSNISFIRGNPIQVKLQGADGILSYSLRDTVTGGMYSSNVSTYQDMFGINSNIVFSNTVGSNAYYGFTGTTTGSNDTKIYNWYLGANPYP